MRSLELTGVCLLVAAAVRAGAQTTSGTFDGSLDIGTALLRQPGLPGSSVLTLASQLRYDATRGSVGGSGIVALTPEQRFTAQGLASASVYAPPGRKLRWELAASASAFGLSGASTTGSWQVLGREHLSLSTGGLFAGLGVAATRRTSKWLPAFVAHGGAFRRLDPLGTSELSGSIAYTRAELAPDQNGSFGGGRTVTSYSDAVGFWSHERGPWELLVGGGVRLAHGGMERTSSWAAGSATLWITPRIGLTGAAGRALADVVRGVPTVRYVSLAVRVGFRRRSMTTLAGPISSLGEGSAASGPQVTVLRGEGGLRVISVRVAAAKEVELMADFTQWEPVKLIRDAAKSDAWTVSLPVAAGAHRIAVRVDGGEWQVPTNLPRVSDEFGGSSGMISVP